MGNTTAMVVFGIDHQRFAIPLEAVDRVLRSCIVTKIPEAPPDLYGIIDFHSQLLPVCNTRKKLWLPAKEIDINDRFVLLWGHSGLFVIVVDYIEGVCEIPNTELVFSERLGNGLNIEAATHDTNGIILCYKPDHFQVTASELSILDATPKSGIL